MDSSARKRSYFGKTYIYVQKTNALAERDVYMRRWHVHVRNDAVRSVQSGSPQKPHRPMHKRFQVAPEEEKSIRLRSGEYGGQATSSPRSIHLPRHVIWRWWSPAIIKCAGAPLYMKHTFWSAVCCTLCSNSGKSEKCTYVQVSSTLSRQSESQHSFPSPVVCLIVLPSLLSQFSI
ncbi:hypothetical protein TNCV_579811 [Trichonephila clavipes]|nr:hypothetical protein TNCV_579811 [Trichonephila clavipes]